MANLPQHIISFQFPDCRNIARVCMYLICAYCKIYSVGWHFASSHCQVSQFCDMHSVLGGTLHTYGKGLSICLEERVLFWLFSSHHSSVLDTFRYNHCWASPPILTAGHISCQISSITSLAYQCQSSWHLVPKDNSLWTLLSCSHHRYSLLGLSIYTHCQIFLLLNILS